MVDRLDVWLDDAPASTLRRDRGGDVTFAYTPSYQALRAAPSLSVSMPRHVSEHPPDAVAVERDLVPDDVAGEFVDRAAARGGDVTRALGTGGGGAAPVRDADVRRAARRMRHPLTPATHDSAIRNDDAARVVGRDSAIELRFGGSASRLRRRRHREPRRQ